MRLRRSPRTSTVDPWDGVVALLFPGGLDAAQRRRVDAVVAGMPPSLGLMRRALGVLDQQVAESSMTIRWSADDIEFVDVRGVRLATDRADASVSNQIGDGAYEPHVVAMLDLLLGPGDIFVDIGANIGYHTVIGAALVGPAGRVFAIEASAENARLLLHTVESNGLHNVTVLPLALSAGWGHVAFGSHVGSNGGFLADDAEGSGSGRGTVVPTAPLDDLDLGEVALVKVDVEGAEALVFDGAPKLLAEHRPSVIMEFSVEMTTRVSRRDPAAHLNRFIDLGYSISVVDRETHEPLPIRSVDALLADWGPLSRIEDLLLQPTED